MTPLRAIRKICVACVGSPYDVAGCGGDKCLGGSKRLVRECESDCPLHEYRFGRNPKRAGMGRKDAFKRIVSGGFSSQDTRLAPGE